jgi:hypothetical protein
MGRVFEFIPELQSLKLTNPTNTEVDSLDARRHLTLNSINTIQELFSSKQSLPILRSWDELIEYQDCSTPLCDLKFALIQDQIFQLVVSRPSDEYSKLERFNLNPYNLCYFFDPLFNSFDQSSSHASRIDPYLTFLKSESKPRIYLSKNFKIFLPNEQPMWSTLVDMGSFELFNHFKKYLGSEDLIMPFESARLRYESIIHG